MSFVAFKVYSDMNKKLFHHPFYKRKSKQKELEKKSK